MVGALKQQAIVALQFAMVSGENDVGIRLPAAISQIVKDLAQASSMSSFSMWV